VDSCNSSVEVPNRGNTNRCVLKRLYCASNYRRGARRYCHHYAAMRSAPSCYASVQSTVPVGACPAVRAMSRFKQSENPNESLMRMGPEPRRHFYILDPQVTMLEQKIHGQCQSLRAASARRSIPFRGSMAGLPVPLPTLRRYPRGHRRRHPI